jgi:hypothetical protein
MEQLDVWPLIFRPVLLEMKKRLEVKLDTEWIMKDSACLDCVIYLLENLEAKQ